MATGVQPIPPFKAPLNETGELEFRKHSNTARFTKTEPTEENLGNVTVEISQISKERDPCGFIKIFKSFVKSETGRDTSFVRCVSIPGLKSAHLLVDFPGKRPYFYPFVSSVSIARRFYNEFSSANSTTLNFQRTNGKQYSIFVTGKHDHLTVLANGNYGVKYHTLVRKSV